MFSGWCKFAVSICLLRVVSIFNNFNQIGNLARKVETEISSSSESMMSRSVEFLGSWENAKSLIFRMFIFLGNGFRLLDVDKATIRRLMRIQL